MNTTRILRIRSHLAAVFVGLLAVVIGMFIEAWMENQSRWSINALSRSCQDEINKMIESHDPSHR